MSRDIHFAAKAQQLSFTGAPPIANPSLSKAAQFLTNLWQLSLYLQALADHFGVETNMMTFFHFEDRLIIQ